ncbi:MAG: hypothetical protein PHC68_03690 [Syntrophorhabdaceae bacterium]|nr:hypothetical protein [Syntrophorhabdaceae bacterium]
MERETGLENIASLDNGAFMTNKEPKQNQPGSNGVEESACMGWKAFSEMTGMSIRKAQYMKDKLLNAGVIYYMRVGRPPRKRMVFFPSLVKRYMGLMGNYREIV